MTAKWDVKVEKLSKLHYRTTFRVDQQFFTLADVEDAEGAEEHCQFIADMFQKALKRIGVQE